MGSIGELGVAFGPLADRPRPIDCPAGSAAEPPEAARSAEIAEAGAAVRDAEARIFELTAALEAAAKENDALRWDKHRLGERAWRRSKPRRPKVRESPLFLRLPPTPIFPIGRSGISRGGSFSPGAR